MGSSAYFTKDPRALVQYIMDTNPNADDEELFEKFCSSLTPEMERIVLDAYFDEHWPGIKREIEERANKRA